MQTDRNQTPSAALCQDDVSRLLLTKEGDIWSKIEEGLCRGGMHSAADDVLVHVKEGALRFARIHSVEKHDCRVIFDFPDMDFVEMNTRVVRFGTFLFTMQAGCCLKVVSWHTDSGEPKKFHFFEEKLAGRGF